MFRLVKKRSTRYSSILAKTSVKTDSQQSFGGAVALFVSYFLGTWVAPTIMSEEAGLTTPQQGDQFKDWNGTRVPQPVHEALTTKYRGQKGLGPKQIQVLDFFIETARAAEGRWPGDDVWWW